MSCTTRSALSVLPAVPLLAALLPCALAPAQNIVWGQLGPATSPIGRYQHAIAYDSIRQRTIVYGGYSNSAGLADTWEWDGATWTQRAALSPPQIRRWFAMAYDAARQRVVLYGGQSNGGTYPTDTWLWNGTTWTQVVTPGPGLRWRHTMAYDAARQRVVLFGGSRPGAGGSIWNDETWEWDGSSWLQRQPATSPPGRTFHAMAYDSVRQRVVVFGGATSGWVYDNQTWEWDGTTWTQATPPVSPSPRGEHAMAFDESRQTMVLFGGYDPVSGLSLRDTWEWNGSTWLESTPTVRPSARRLHTMAYHAASDAVLLFGGGIALADTWSTYLPATANAYGSGCGTPALGFVPDPATPPRVGQTARADITNAPSSLVGVAMGWSNQQFGTAPLPLALDFLGMPGCFLLQSTEVLGLGATPASPTTFSFGFAVPNIPIALGKRLYLQAYALAPGQNALQVVASNGIEWLFGNI